MKQCFKIMEGLEGTTTMTQQKCEFQMSPEYNERLNQLNSPILINNTSALLHGLCVLWKQTKTA